MSIKTPEQISRDVFPFDGSDPVTVMECRSRLADAIYADREAILADMADRSHKDDWGVPCVYVQTYADHLRAVTNDVR